MDRQTAEFWTWRLMAALAATLPVEWVIETHAGGGLYDTVELLLGRTNPLDPTTGVRLACNRPGSVHVLPDPDGSNIRDLLTDLSHGLPVEDAVRWVQERSDVTGQIRTAIADSFRFMSDVIAVAIGGGEGPWEWRNGYLDSSGGEGGRRDDLFRAVPASAATCAPEPDDLFGVPEYRFWFLTCDGAPRLAVAPMASQVYLDDASFPVESPAALERCIEKTTGPRMRPEEGATSAQLAAAARLRFRPLAERLVSRIVDDAQPFMPGTDLTEMAVWFTAQSDSLLILAVGDHENVVSMDQALAYALAWQEDKDLILVIPETHASQTLARLAWIDSPVRVFEYGPELLPRPAIVPSRAEVLAAARELGLRRTREHDLGDAAELVEPLVTWADEHWALEEAHRPSYLAWHCEGRQVLALARSGGGVKITAGVNYTKDVPPGEEKAGVLVISLGDPFTRTKRGEIEARVSRAIWKRLAGHDRGHVEHRLQAALDAGPHLRRRLGLSDLRREYPAWRYLGRPGFLDFLGIDRDDRLHVVETKVNPEDVTVLLQALDYAIWVMANAAEIRADRQWANAPESERVVIDFICAPRVKPESGDTPKPYGFAVGRYLAAQFEVLSPSIPWRVWLVANPIAEAPDLSGSSWRALPDTPLVDAPIRPPRWPRRVQEALQAGGLLTRHRSAEAALLPEARPMLVSLTERGLGHRWVLSVRSSQALALNLFAPLPTTGLKAIFEELGVGVETVEPVEFEYCDPDDRLGEKRPESPHQTQVDVVLRGRKSAGVRVVVFVEVKFTEEFGSCSAYENPANLDRDVCRSAGLFGGLPQRCFQLSNHGAGRRHYDDYLANGPSELLEGAADSGGCLVRGNLSQPMRNLALGQLLVTSGETEFFVYAVCAPMAHGHSWRRLQELQAALPDTDQRAIRSLRAETVARNHADGGSALGALYRGLF